MAKNKGVRILITLECTECRSNTNKLPLVYHVTLHKRIVVIILHELNLKNIVDTVINLLYIRKLNKLC